MNILKNRNRTVLYSICLGLLLNSASIMCYASDTNKEQSSTEYKAEATTYCDLFVGGAMITCLVAMVYLFMSTSAHKIE